MMNRTGESTQLLFFVNGTEVVVGNPDPEMSLLYFIRNQWSARLLKGVNVKSVKLTYRTSQPMDSSTAKLEIPTELGLTGSKLGCGEGGCGACTVMVSRRADGGGGVKHYAVNACLTPLCAVHGTAVTTVEGIGSTSTALHPCQERIAKAHGSQCGFCTPGFVMSMYALLRSNHTLSEEDIEEAFQGNLCRCTGYRPILDGYKTFSCKFGACKESDRCCGGNPCSPSPRLFDSSKFRSLDSTQEPIFPAKLQLMGAPEDIMFLGPRVQWYQPATLKELLALRDKFPHTSEKGKPQHRMVMGNTAIGVEMKFKNALYDVLICPASIRELNNMEVTDGGLVVGGAVTLTELGKKLKQLVDSIPAYRAGVFSAILDMLSVFAGPQIRNVSALGSTICNASPTSDLNPLLMAARAVVNLASVDGVRSIAVDASFFPGYKRTALKPNEVLVSVVIPFTTKNEFFFGYKQSRRRKVDTAIVNAGFRVTLEALTDEVKELSLCYGGMGRVTVSASQTEGNLKGRVWDDKLLQDAVHLLSEEFPLQSDVPGGMSEYRRSLAVSFFFKFFWCVKSQLPGVSLESRLQSLVKPFHRPTSESVQGFQQGPEGQCSGDQVGRPLMHLSAPLQASGEARYTDDIPKQARELYAGLVLSTHAHAKITTDWSLALKVDGVEGYVDVEDVPGSNMIGSHNDERVFADGEVTHFGQIIGMVLAKDRIIAQRAVKLVNVSYTDMPSIITIEDAIVANSFFPTVHQVSRGEFSSAYEACPQRLEGEVRVGGQDHFYLETHGCLAVPKGESNEMDIFASTQCVDGTQKMAAKALGVPANRISVKVKRIGGGFGGKESNSFLSTPVAVAANKFKRPVRAILGRNEDMVASGGRHPFLGRYKVGFTESGRLLALDLCLYSNAGASIDTAYGVNERAVTHADNVYNIPNTTIKVKACCTNLVHNTAFRGYGGPQGMMIMEQIVARVAGILNLPTEAVQELNMYKEGDSTPYGAVLGNCTVRRCWTEIKKTSDFASRQAEVEKYNSENRWKKRGMALTPTKYGIAFTRLPLNQGAALLHVYTDGSVLLSHGGMEMGQGLHTKMVQVCSHLLVIPPERIHIVDTDSGVVANASPTGASHSTDLYGMAVKDCCDQILKRLAPVKAAAPDAGWDTWIRTAYMQRINLSAQGFYSPPLEPINWDTGKGNPYSYFVYGVSCSEVEVDCLTGSFTVLRTDIVNDVGDSINPAIDIGQVEGAFMQGMGLFTMEQCVYLEGSSETQRGQLFTTGPSTYKIPSCQDIPVDFRVALLGRSPNPKAIFSSKAVGEPPLFLAASVFFAIQNAIRAAREDAGESRTFAMDSPATCERIRMACVDHLTKQVDVSCDGKLWNIEV